jgi:polysaccharide export outer membrane protein
MKKTFFLLTVIACFFFVQESFAKEQDAPTVDNLYRVGIHDVISIEVAGQQSFSTTVGIAIDGTISYPYVGNIYVKGLTLEEIRRKVTEILSDGILQLPVVTVSLERSQSKQVYVLGEDVQSRKIPFDRSLTLAKALILIGGVDVGNPFGSVTIRRKQEGKTEFSEMNFGFKEVLGANNSAGIPLEPEDILIIHKNPSVLIQGEVVKPGTYNIEENMTIGKALTMAGGISEGGLYGTVKLRRRGKTDSIYKDRTIDLNDILRGNKSGDIILLADDIVIVESNKVFFVHGEVEGPGKYVLEREMTVVKAITEAGGITDDGRYGKIKIRRKREEGPGYDDIEVNLQGIISGAKEDILIEPDDILIVERNKNIIIQGEVVKPGTYVLEENMTIGRALSKAGGVTEGGLYGKVKLRRVSDEGAGFQDVELDLRKILQGDKSGSMLLKHNDIIIVDRNKTILVYGEVNNIGEYALSDGMTVFKAIVMAGGFNKWGSPSRIKVLRPREGNAGFEILKVNIKNLLKGDPSEDIFLKPGDIVVVSSGIL